MHASHQPGDSQGGPWYGQLGDLALLDYLHYSEDCRHAQDDRAVFHPRVIHYNGYLVLIVPLTQGILTFIIMNPSGSTMILPMPSIGRIFPPTS